MLVASCLLLAIGCAPDVTVGDRLDVQWSAPDGCPTEEEIRHAIDRYLGRDDFDAVLDRVQVAGAISGTMSDGWQLTTTIALPSGIVERTVEASQCSDLANAAGLMIAVALDPLRVSQQVAPVETKPHVDDDASDRSDPDEPDEPAATPPAASTEPTPPTEPKRALSLELRVGAGGEIGTTPKLRGGTWLGFALVLSHVRIEASGQWWIPREYRPFESSPGAGASIQMGGAALRTCYVPTVGRLELPSCLAIEGGLLRAQGVGLDEARVSRRPWLALVAGQELAFITRRHVGMWLALDAVINLLRPRFHVEDLGPVLTPAVAGFRFLGGPAVRF